jgi:hypothetical protein
MPALVGVILTSATALRVLFVAASSGVGTALLLPMLLYEGAQLQQKTSAVEPARLGDGKYLRHSATTTTLTTRISVALSNPQVTVAAAVVADRQALASTERHAAAQKPISA